MADSPGKTIIEAARDYKPQAAEFLEQCYMAQTGRIGLSRIVDQPNEGRCFRIVPNILPKEFELRPVYRGFINILEDRRGS